MEEENSVERRYYVVAQETLVDRSSPGVSLVCDLSVSQPSMSFIKHQGIIFVDLTLAAGSTLFPSSSLHPLLCDDVLPFGQLGVV